jgi:hypothetical protein
VSELACDSVTLKVSVDVPASPSVIDWSSMLTSGMGSSFVMVPSPDPSRMFAFVAFDRTSVRCSSGSVVPSPFTVTSTVFAVSPGLKVTVPDAAT